MRWGCGRAGAAYPNIVFIGPWGAWGASDASGGMGLPQVPQAAAFIRTAAPQYGHGLIGVAIWGAPRSFAATYRASGSEATQTTGIGQRLTWCILSLRDPPPLRLRQLARFRDRDLPRRRLDARVRYGKRCRGGDRYRHAHLISLAQISPTAQFLLPRRALRGMPHACRRSSQRSGMSNAVPFGNRCEQPKRVPVGRGRSPRRGRLFVRARDRPTHVDDAIFGAEHAGEQDCAPAIWPRRSARSARPQRTGGRAAPGRRVCDRRWPRWSGGSHCVCARRTPNRAHR